MRILLIIVGCLLLGLVGYLTAFYTVSPNFDAKAVAKPGGWMLQLDPNFVVNDIRSIRIQQGGADLLTRTGVLKGRQAIALPPTVLPGSTVTVECELQYDRIAPSTIRIQHQIVLK